MDENGLIMTQSGVHLWRDMNGTTAVEFAIVAPVFIMLIIGLIYVCMALFAVGSLHYAVEQGARCSSVQSTVCTDSSATLAYTKNHYYGTSSPTFTTAIAACGKQVTGATTFTLFYGMGSLQVPITATACFPPV